MKKRKIYLHMKTLEEAREIFLGHFRELKCAPEIVPTFAVRGRVSCAPVFAKKSVPAYHSAAMDGIAVEAEITFGVTEENPKILKIGQDAVFVDTGDPLPEFANAVIMIENVQPLGKGTVEIRKAAYPWQHVRKVGEDIVTSEMLLPTNHEITSHDIGALLAAGVLSVEVYKRPRILIIPTGDELVSPEEGASRDLKPGEIIEFNSSVLANMAEECGAIPEVHAIVADDPSKLKDVLTGKSNDFDMLIINAGSSSGTEDYTAGLVSELGRIFVHGVTIMPGKPTVLGEINGIPVVGIPGYPVSAIISFEQFVRPLLFSMQGKICPPKESLTVTVGRKIPSRLGLEEFVRVILGRVGEKVVASPLSRGAGVITSLTRADAIIRIPHDSEGINDGEEVQAELLKPSWHIENTIVMIGSHDNTIDLIADYLQRCDSGFFLTSSHVGSMGGLMALKRGHAHIAGSHLLDPVTGDYNFPYIERYLKDVPVRVVNLVYREQGLIVQKGNPKGIRGLEDLTGTDVMLINRQRGSGTRVLLDYRLEQLGIDPDEIKGYEREEYTHMAVAVNVLSGSADVGMGIYAAAKALDLDFIPVVSERYDLVIREVFWNDEKIQLLLKIIRSADFKKMVLDLGGYDVSDTGKEMVGLRSGVKNE